MRSLKAWQSLNFGKYFAAVCQFDCLRRDSTLEQPQQYSTHLSIHSSRNKWVRNNKEWKMNGPPTSLTVSRKMRKNFAGVVLLIMAGILICLALSNMVLMQADQDYQNQNNQKSEKSDSDSRITFRSLKGNRKIMLGKPSDAYSLDPNFYPK